MQNTVRRLRPLHVGSLLALPQHASTAVAGGVLDPAARWAGRTRRGLADLSGREGQRFAKLLAAPGRAVGGELRPTTVLRRLRSGVQGIAPALGLTRTALPDSSDVERQTAAGGHAREPAPRVRTLPERVLPRLLGTR